MSGVANREAGAGIRIRIVPGSPFSRREWSVWLSSMVDAVLQGQNEAAKSSVTLTVGSDVILELTLMRDGEIAALNAAYLACPGPTNILSFPAGHAAHPFCSAAMPRKESCPAWNREGRRGELTDLGSLFLSVDTLHRECLLYGQNKEEHARRLLAHGLAHLLGYDHGSAMDAICRVMLTGCAGDQPRNI